MVPVPSRILKQASTWILMLIGVLDLAHLLMVTLFDLHAVDSSQLAIGNAVLAFLSGVAKLFQQNIALTDEQKVVMIAAVQNAPSKGPNEPLTSDTTTS
jgi:hypothetical protein